VAHIVRRTRKLYPRLVSSQRQLALASIGVGVLALVAIVPYMIRFSGGLSDKQEIWAYFGDYFGGVLSVLMSFSSLIVALYVLMKTSQDRRFKQIYHFTDEFRSDRMSLNLKLLWDFYEYDDFRKLKKRYTGNEAFKRDKLQERYRKEQQLKSDVYQARRSVSYFYLHLAIFLRTNRLDEDNILALWPASSMSTLEKIIMPCEEAITADGIVPNKFVHFQYLLERWRQFDQVASGKAPRSVG
jgi:hypothetical protein